MSTSNFQKIEDEAAQWVARMDAGQWTADDEAELQAWLRGDPCRSGELLRAQAAWMTLDRVSVKPEASANTLATWPRRSLIAGGIGALAASLIGGVWLTAATSYRTRLGEIRRVPLSDGSVVAINTASDIEVKYEPKRRVVKIARGEAWFQVARNAQQPFVVEASQVIVQAVGTAFSVRRMEKGAEILVSEGVVEAWAAAADGHKIRLVAGERAIVADNSAVDLVKTSASSVDRALAWRSGLIDLADESLDEAAQEFNRYNARKLVISDRTLAAEKFDGVFHVEDPEGFAKAVEASLNVPVDLSNPATINIGKSRG